MNALRDALLRGRRRPRNTGTGSPTLYRGDGYEFVELREYVPGDDIRRIDWAATARTGELQTRVMLEDVALTIAAILDTSDSMQVGRKRPLAQSALEIIDLWFGAACSADRCMRVLSNDIVAPQAAHKDAPFSFTEACRVASVALPRGCALLVVGDFFDLPDDDELLNVLGTRCDCTALIARDPWRDGLPLSGFVRIMDMENRSSVPVFIGKTERERYVRSARARENMLVDRLNMANWRVEFFDEDDGGAALLRAFALL